MSRRRFNAARPLLEDLLNRYEAKPAVTRLLAYLDVEAFRSITDFDACVDELAMVERAGGVALRRRRIGGADQIESVQLAEPIAVYRHLGRTSAPDNAHRALGPLLQTADRPALQVILEEIRSAWARNVRAFGLGPNDTARLTQAVALTEALVLRWRNGQPPASDFRSFSRAVVQDSKALDRLALTVSLFLRRLEPDAITPQMQEPEDVIGAFGVTRLPRPFLVSGPLALDGQALPALSYLGVPPEDIGRLTFTRAPTYVLTVENFTSFIRHVREINADNAGAVVFSGGFPSRPTLDGILRLAALAKVPTFHWGDIDLGGLRIFIHLEQALLQIGRTLQPHLMTEALLRRSGGPSPRKAWVKGLTPSAQSGVYPLWAALAAQDLDLELEQEGVDPVHPA